MEAAKEENSPVILQASEGARNYAGQEYIVGLVKIALQDYPEIPTALHLDHGSSYEICKACIDGGFSSVMYDGSKHPYEERSDNPAEVFQPFPGGHNPDRGRLCIYRRHGLCRWR